MIIRGAVRNLRTPRFTISYPPPMVVTCGPHITRGLVSECALLHAAGRAGQPTICSCISAIRRGIDDVPQCGVHLAQFVRRKDILVSVDSGHSGQNIGQSVGLFAARGFVKLFTAIQVRVIAPPFPSVRKAASHIFHPRWSLLPAKPLSPRLCLVVVVAPAEQLASYATRLLRHRSFRTHALRSAKVVRLAAQWHRLLGTK